jgi:hypothetical protein
MPDIVTISETNNIVTVYDGRGFKGEPGDSFDQTLNTTDAVEFAGLVNNGLTFPTADGTAGQVIETDGAGVLTFVTPSGGDFLPLAGGTMTGNIVFDGTSGQFIGKGSFDTARSGNYGISIVCSVGYEFNWQAGWLVTTEQSSATPRPLYLDSLAGTTLRAWDSSASTGTEVTHLGITFADTTVQTTAYTGGAGVSSLTAGTGISLDVTTGDITVTNSEPDQTVVLTDGTGITVTGTYPSFTITSSITQYTDTDARLALSAGTGISYDNTTGIVTNDNPDQTVTLTDGTGITVTGTYPSFTITSSVTQYADTDARLALSAGTGISYDNTTGIITNDNPDQTVTLTDGTGITITGTYPSFTIAYSGAGGGSGTVTTASVVSANGFAGSVATDTTTPAITISTSITGLLIGDGTAIAAATAGTDYVIPSGSITGSAASLSATLDVASGGTGLVTLTADNVILGNGTSSPTFVAPSTSGNVLTSNGTTWQSTAPAGGGSGTVTTASVVSANGFGGTVATDTTTPAITISTSITGVLKGNGTALSAATAGTDYVAPAGALGTPSSGTLTSCTGLPISTGVSGLGTSVAAFLATPSSANLKTAITDETGTGGSLVFATSPALTTPTVTGLNETKTAPTISSGVLALNCALGNVFHVSLNAAITSLTFSNIPSSGTAYGLTLAFTADGTARAVTWPAAVKWSGGTAPTLTSTNAKVDIFVLTTWDAGTTWYAMTGGQNF